MAADARFLWVRAYRAARLLERARDELCSYGLTGLSLLEASSELVFSLPYGPAAVDVVVYRYA